MLNLPCQNWSYLASLHCKVTQLKRNHCVLQLYDHLKKRIAEKDDFLPLNPFVFEQIVMVKTKTELEELVHNLENKVEIAVDLEHEYIDGENDQKSCRMISIVQISTRTKNYVIDALLLKDDLHLLEELFGNEAVQVVHFSGKVSSGLQVELKNAVDIQKLQKKLKEFIPPWKQGLYCKFDVVIEKYHGFKPNRGEKKVSWMERPLCKENIDFASRKTHFLLSYRDCLLREIEEEKKRIEEASSGVYDA